MNQNPQVFEPKTSKDQEDSGTNRKAHSLGLPNRACPFWSSFCLNLKIYLAGFVEFLPFVISFGVEVCKTTMQGCTTFAAHS